MLIECVGFLNTKYDYVNSMCNVTNLASAFDDIFKKSVKMTIEILTEMSYYIQGHKMFIFLKGYGSTYG